MAPKTTERKAALAAFLETATVLHPAAEKGELDEEEQLELAKILLLLLDFSISVTEENEELLKLVAASAPAAAGTKKDKGSANKRTHSDVEDDSDDGDLTLLDPSPAKVKKTASTKAAAPKTTAGTKDIGELLKSGLKSGLQKVTGGGSKGGKGDGAAKAGPSKEKKKKN